MGNHIILIGFMGSGKSTVGKELAKQLNLAFVDSDEVIEKEQGKSINEIFDEAGEDAFRSMEQEFISTLSDLEQSVIAVGGGMPCFEDNIDRLKATGKVFYLNTSLMTLTQRLVNERENRPLLANLSQNELSSYVFELLTNRTAFYRKAHLIIPNEGKDYLKVVSEIRKALN